MTPHKKVFLFRCLITLCLIQLSSSIPVPKYNPNHYYGPKINLTEVGNSVEPPRKRRETDNDYYQDIFSSPEFQSLAPSEDEILEEIMSLPQMNLRQLVAYIRESYKRPSTQLTRSYPSVSYREITYLRPAGDRSFSNNPNEYEDYEYEDKADDLDGASQNGRRTFQLIADMLSGGLGGGQGQTTIESDTRMRQQAQIEADQLREMRETSSLQQLRNQQTIDALRQETLLESNRNRENIDSLKHQLSSLADQKEREHREKEDLRFKLQYENESRQREKEELKRKLEMHRDRELMNMQSKLQQEATLRELETFEMQKQMEMEKVKMEMEMRHKNEMESQLNMERHKFESAMQEMQQQRDMEKIMMQKSSNDNYESIFNKKIINEYRQSGLESSPWLTPAVMPDLSKPSSFSQQPPTVALGPGQSIYIRP